MDKNEIDKMIISSVKEHDKDAAGVFRLVKAEFLKAEKEHGITPDNNKCMQILFKMIEQRKDSIQQYTEADRQDLADIEQKELEILNTLVPKLPSEEELTDTIEKIVTDLKNTNGAVSLKDTRTVIDKVNETFGIVVPNTGKYVSAIIKKYI